MQADNACGRGAAGGRGVLRDGRYDLLRIIIADGEKEHALSVTKVLKKHGYNTMLTPNAIEAQKLLEHVTPVALIMSLTYEGSEMDGFELYRRLRLFPALLRIPVFLTVDSDDKDVLHAAIGLGIDHVLRRPVDSGFIVAALRGRKAREEMMLI